METQPHQLGPQQIKLIRPLGKGGFGAVYLAEVHARDGLVHRMAVKILREEFSADSEVGARARDEARLMSQISHDNVVHVYGLTYFAKRSTVLMEYVDGIDCVSLIRDAGARGQGVPLGVAARIIECSADALHSAYHEISPQTGKPLHVVHRDIKPGNLLVSVNGTVKVMDFGVARADFEREAETKSIQFGTQRYMAPERWLEGTAGPKSDIFSLGITFWELVTGEKFPQIPLAAAKYQERVDADIAYFLRASKADGRAEAICESVLRGMFAYSERDRLAAYQVSEMLVDLSETHSGPSLRRYARKWIPPLLESRKVELEGDASLQEFTGTMFTADAPVGEEEPPWVPPAKALPSKSTTMPTTPSRGIASVDEPAAEDLGVSSRTLSPQKSRRPALGIVAVLLVGLAWLVVRDTAEPTVDDPSATLQQDEQPGVVNAPLEAEGGDVAVPDFEDPVTASKDTPEVPGEVRKRTPSKRRKAVARKKVKIKVLADPREGSVKVGALSAKVAESLTLPEGTHAFRYTGDGWSASCTVKINSQVEKIKFEKESRSCVLLP